ncbi:MAG: polysaccharide deacetylase family protein [Chloroflexi bacterium]|nr:polysaccharide deacetylase family protein [Chloroflexota bacterium]
MMRRHSDMGMWPDGKTVALGFIVPWERWPDDLGSSRSHQRTSQRPLPPGARYDRDMWAIYDHQYGETQGVRRLLNLFDDHGVKATFVINGMRVEESPDLAREVQARGHEMASENYLHEYAVMHDVDDERKSLQATVEAFNNVLGQPPTGYISPGHRPTPNTVPLLFDLGYRWDADFQFDDVPFVIADGERRMVGMPYAHVSDYHTYASNARTPRQVLEMLRDELRALRREGLRGDPKMIGYAMHPYICHGFRTEIIHEFLSEVGDLGDVWIATRNEISDWVLTHEKEYASLTLDEIVAQFPPG